MEHDIIVMGGGAAGIFAALAAKEAHPESKVTVLEKSAALLSKVRVSGGGRCNVTHSCFDPKLLAQNYPRGALELLGPFQRFQPKDTIEWFTSRGVDLKTEEDGRMFPTTDQSETIIGCLLEEAKKLGVEIRQRQRIEKIEKVDDKFRLDFKEGGSFCCKALILATGSSSEGHLFAEQLGHTIQKPVPSLFTLNVPEFPLAELSGISLENAQLEIIGTNICQQGPLLITHFGFSGPAALRLSAWGARILNEKNYNFEVGVNWLPHLSFEQIYQKLLQYKKHSPEKTLFSENLFRLPKNLWRAFVGDERMNDLSHEKLRSLANGLHDDRYKVEGKTTHKEEFVTCGGITLKEVNFKKMESKICPGLFFAGEILDIDGITGGFNFQNGWTTGFIAGCSALL